MLVPLYREEDMDAIKVHVKIPPRQEWAGTPGFNSQMFDCITRNHNVFFCRLADWNKNGDEIIRIYTDPNTKHDTTWKYLRRWLYEPDTYGVFV
jgi:hypothetical protein